MYNDIIYDLKQLFSTPESEIVLEHVNMTFGTIICQLKYEYQLIIVPANEIVGFITGATNKGSNKRAGIRSLARDITAASMAYKSREGV